ncbi:flagellar assembly protein FliW [Clostridium gasigenes]|uniref:Flagellar assembly factor FliW n=1 Tax=Clostridium gasigenes TaxID=94869 RepID=A0A7X0RA67_9CLOT|nr:flagellar assembly protein FliW [Clostridium gasigenes]MBB6624467.1 flagellar assembly protein FliW [Clostridium gasigenes]MBB6715951.1 flagellar assembly protein FliW [Clostridium gasigenes]MBU3088638.1 flagellar assembly protein FliW [Clostridium gasigenes]
MELISPVHGKIQYKKEEVITFKKGIPGCEEYKNYVIKEIEESPFKILQSVQNNELAFIIISPFDVVDNYEIKLSEEIIKNIKIENQKDVMLYSIVNVSSKVENITTNLRAPLVLNIKEKFGEQLIVDKDVYKIKHPLM